MNNINYINKVIRDIAKGKLETALFSKFLCTVQNVKVAYLLFRICLLFDILYIIMCGKTMILICLHQDISAEHIKLKVLG